MKWLFTNNILGTGTWDGFDIVHGHDAYDVLYADTDIGPTDKVYYEVTTIASSFQPTESILMMGMADSLGGQWNPAAGGTAATIYIRDGSLYGAAGGTAATSLSIGPFPIVHGVAVDFFNEKFWIRDSVGYRNGNPLTNYQGATFDKTELTRLTAGNGGADLEYQGNLGPNFEYDIPTGFTAANPQSYAISGTVLVGGRPARREVHVHDRATGVLLSTSFSDAITGEYALEVVDDSPVYTVILEDASLNKYESRVMDFITPTIIV